VLFGLAHIDFYRLFGGDWSGFGPMKVLNTALMGFGYASVYLRSRNLLGCVLLHAVYDIMVHLSNGLIASTQGGLIQVIGVVMDIALYAAVPIFAVWVCVRGEPKHPHASRVY
jgi:membrane protease YdiL (CAAX protease family)